MLSEHWVSVKIYQNKKVAQKMGRNIPCDIFATSIIKCPGSWNVERFSKF